MMNIRIMTCATLMAVSLPCFESGCAAKPDLPVKLLVRESVVGEGSVIQFHNESNQRFVLTVCVENKTGKDRIERTLPLGPVEMQEMSWLEGWKFTSGDRITVKHEKYSPATATVPYSQ